ncbi:hypothetical protein WAJ43_24350, partial [Acinetobacter baumannii]
LTDEKPEGEENSFRDNNLALRESIRDPDAHFEEPDAHNLGSEHLAPDNLFNSNSSNNLTQMLTPTDEVSIWQNLHTS